MGPEYGRPNGNPLPRGLFLVPKPVLASALFNEAKMEDSSCRGAPSGCVASDTQYVRDMRWILDAAAMEL